MKKISQDTIDKIMQSAKIEDVIGEEIALKKSGSSLAGKCPSCQAEGKGKGIIVTPAKDIYKCFSCGIGGKTAIDYLQKIKKLSYPEALIYLAKKYNIEVVEEFPLKKQVQRSKEITFCDIQLAESGLVPADLKAEVYIDESTKSIVDIFESGTLDQFGKITNGNDLIIWYYDLDGKPTMYQKQKSTTKMEHFFRVRWQFPEQHLDKTGKPKKYQSPYGSGIHLYIPDIVRKAYQNGRTIKRLYLQEGEKKSEKASKHGLFSLGLTGINSLGQTGRLPYEINLIVQRCKVEEVIFMLDSDLFTLTENPSMDKPLDGRPRSFFSAVKNFKDYFRTFINQNIYIETYFAYYKKTDHKGIDDQLNYAFKNQELTVRDDISAAINEKDGEGLHYKVVKLTTMNDGALLALWHLESAEKFATHYYNEIQEKGLKVFTFGRHRWRFNEEGTFELAQPIRDEEKFWKDLSFRDREDKLHEKYQFMYSRAYYFIKNRGFGRIMMKTGKYQFANVSDKVVKIVDSYEIKDYVMTLAKEICPEPVMDMLYRGGKMYLGHDSLGNIDFMYPEFKHYDRDYQILFFKNKYWKISASGIEENPICNFENNVWADKIIDFEVTKTPQLLEIDKISHELLRTMSADDQNHWRDHVNEFSIDFTEQGKKCHFLNFLANTGDFYWKKKETERTTEEMLETNRHLMSKLTAIGYMLHKYRNKSCEKAIIGMDGKMSEVGSSNGRSGKSLLGFAIEKVVPTVYIGAKSKDLTEDKFWAEEVTEKTDIIFLDDVRTNFDFEFFFPIITGKLTVNGKSEKKFTLSEEETPKIYVTTNHAISGDSGSFRDRQHWLAFSDYYNENHKPQDDFGLNFWSEWGADQNNLFYNLMAQCIQFYLQFGLVSPPLERLELRRKRQFIGETFMEWATSYFGMSEDMNVNEIYNSERVNTRNVRQDLYSHFIILNPNEKKFTTPTKFKKKMKIWCEFMGLQFNPHIMDSDNRPGGDDKSGGVEYFTITNSNYLNQK